MARLEDSRMAGALVLVAAACVLGFCVWLITVWAPDLQVDPDQRATDPSTSTSAPGEATSPGSPQASTTDQVGVDLVVLGDSFSAGSARDDTLSMSWPQQICDVAGCRYDDSFVEPSSGYVARGRDDTSFGDKVDDIIGAAPEVVVVAGGAYDKGVARQLLRRNVADVLGRLRAGLPGSQIVVLTPFWRSSPPAEVTAVAAAISAQADAQGIEVVEVTDILVADAGLVSADGLPTGAGQTRIAEAVLEPVRRSVEAATGYAGTT